GDGLHRDLPDGPDAGAHHDQAPPPLALLRAPRLLPLRRRAAGRPLRLRPAPPCAGARVRARLGGPAPPRLRWPVAHHAPSPTDASALASRLTAATRTAGSRTARTGTGAGAGIGAAAAA